MPNRATREQAWARPTAHALTAAGYLGFAPHEAQPLGRSRAAPVLPAAAAVDGTHHWVRSPRGNRVEMVWLAAHEAWAPFPETPQAKRLAFRADYLASHGWTYGGLVTPPEPQKAARAGRSSHRPKAAA